MPLATMRSERRSCGNLSPSPRYTSIYWPATLRIIIAANPDSNVIIVVPLPHVGVGEPRVFTENPPDEVGIQEEAELTPDQVPSWAGPSDGPSDGNTRGHKLLAVLTSSIVLLIFHYYWTRCSSHTPISHIDSKTPAHTSKH